MFCLILVSVLAVLTEARAPYTLPATPLLDGRIVGGEDATIEDHPYQVSFQVFAEHHCGASIIAPKMVLTACHCTAGLETYLKYLTVRAGSTIHTKGGQVVKVISIHDHPKYVGSVESFDYDASVLVLEQPLNYGVGVQPIVLQTVGVEVPTGTLARVTGWGRLSSAGSSPLVLQKVDVPRVDQATCKENYSRQKITDRMHCFGYPQGGKDACQGDSGGPLVEGGKLVGVVSWGIGCANENYPGVYAKVANAEIANHIGDIMKRY